MKCAKCGREIKGASPIPGPPVCYPACPPGTEYKPATSPEATGSAVPWQTISTAPKNGTSIEVQMISGKVYEDAHWASDLSGEEQPPFEGWFVPVKSSVDGRVMGFSQIATPKLWRPIPPKCAQHQAQVRGREPQSKNL